MITWLASLIGLLWLIGSSLWIGISIGKTAEKERWLKEWKRAKTHE